MHLTPWDLRLITVEYIQKGILLPKSPFLDLVDDLASSLARALDRFYPLAGRLTVTGAGVHLVISLRCNGEGAEFVHATALEVTVRDITASLDVPPVVWSLFPCNGVLGTDAVLDSSRPLLSAQVTELADGVFLAMSLNHGVVDGTTFWHLFNTWAEIHRRRGICGDDFDCELAAPPPVLDRWFLDTCPVSIPVPFARVEDMVRRPVYPSVRECFFHFSSDSVGKLKAKANAEMAGTATTTISSLQSVLAHVWRRAARGASRRTGRRGTRSSSGAGGG